MEGILDSQDKNFQSEEVFVTRPEDSEKTEEKKSIDFATIHITP